MEGNARDDARDDAVWVCRVRHRVFPWDRLTVVCRSRFFDDGMRPAHKAEGCGVYVRSENPSAVVGCKPSGREG
jgi:hypothetical protein